MNKSIMKNKWVREILSAIAVAVFGFILLNLTFIFDALYQGAIRGIIGLFMPLGPELQLYWFPPLMHISFVVVIGLISWLVFRSRLGVIYKAIYMTVPAAVVLVTTGMFLNHWPIAVYSLGGILTAGTLYFFYRTKQPWLYHYAVILVALAMAIFTLTGGEI
jgi:hypothetical protein